MRYVPTLRACELHGVCETILQNARARGNGSAVITVHNNSTYFQLSHLLCPALDCSSAPTQPQIRSILDDDTLYERYELLTLNRGFDAMMDIAICPRPTCAKPVIVEVPPPPPPPRKGGDNEEEAKVPVIAQALTATCAHCNYRLL